tara:strand:+ start:151 stop:501 length:351 start_codon:yes stop_codon:yes gene_type:complete
MAQLYWKVRAYLEANSKTASEFDNNIKLVNDGAGDYIHTWNVNGLAKPTDAQLTSADTQATKDENNHVVKETRKAAYGDIGDQLDLLYKDMLAGKGDSTGEWFKSIKAVKDANPKE